MSFQSRAAALDALEAVLAAAVETAGGSFVRDPEKPPAASRSGLVIMRDGDSGTPEVILSPTSYAWEHQVEFEVCAPGVDRKSVCEALIAALDPALAADRTLGAAVDDARIVLAPEVKEYEIEGAETERSVLIHVQLSYTTASGAG